MVCIASAVQRAARPDYFPSVVAACDQQGAEKAALELLANARGSVTGCKHITKASELPP
jgi:hypothetical protein